MVLNAISHSGSAGMVRTDIKTTSIAFNFKAKAVSSQTSVFTHKNTHNHSFTLCHAPAGINRKQLVNSAVAGMSILINPNKDRKIQDPQ